MSVRFDLLTLTVACLLLAGPGEAAGQASAGYGPPSLPAKSGYERTSGRHNPALDYFTRSRPRFSVAQALPQPPVLASPTVAPQRSKPFASAQPQPTISPYLGLDIRESEVGLPNYYAFVRPQLEQQQHNRVQQADYQRLQRQVNTAVGGSPTATGEIPTTGHATQFMNPGGYYRTLR